VDSCDLHYCYFSTFAVYEGSNNAHSNVREIFGTNGIGEELSENVSESTYCSHIRRSDIHRIYSGQL